MTQYVDKLFVDLKDFGSGPENVRTKAASYNAGSNPKLISDDEKAFYGNWMLA